MALAQQPGQRTCLQRCSSSLSLQKAFRRLSFTNGLDADSGGRSYKTPVGASGPHTAPSALWKEDSSLSTSGGGGR